MAVTVIAVVSVCLLFHFIVVVAVVLPMSLHDFSAWPSAQRTGRLLMLSDKHFI